MSNLLHDLVMVAAATAMGIAPLVPLVAVILVAVERPTAAQERLMWGMAWRSGLAVFLMGFVLLLISYGLGWAAPSYQGIPLWEQKNYIADFTRR